MTYSFQTFSVGEVLTSSKMNQIEVNVRDHTHGSGGVNATFVAPVLGTPASGNLANCTFPTLNQNTTGNAATATTAGACTGNAATATTATNLSGGTIFGRVVRTAGDILTTSTTLVDVTGATVTFTTGAFPVEIGCAFVHGGDTSGAFNTFNFAVDGAVELGSAGLPFIYTGSGATSRFNGSFSHQTAALSAASHTLKMQWKTNVGQAFILAGTDNSFSFWAHQLR